SVVRLTPRTSVDRQFEIALDQSLAQIICVRVTKLQLDAGVAGFDSSNEVDDLVGRNGAHDAELERRLLQPLVVVRQLLGRLGFLVHLTQVRLEHASKFGDMRIAPLAMEQGSS